MSLQLKPSLIIIGTLLLGILLGVVGSSAIMRSRFQQLQEFGQPHSISSRILRTLGPLDKATEDSLRLILDESEERMHEEITCGRSRIRVIIDSTLLQMEPLLTEEQYARVKDIIGRGPGPHGGMGMRRRPDIDRE